MFFACRNAAANKTWSLLLTADVKCVFNSVMSSTVKKNNKRRFIDTMSSSKSLPMSSPANCHALKTPRLRESTAAGENFLPLSNPMNNEILMETSKMMDESRMVEILPTPDKSERDKKEYRIVRLENGLTALLISDPSRLEDSKPEEETASVSSAATSAESASSDDDDDDDDDDGQTDRDIRKEKLAACSLCVDVGSNSDPRQIQGLSHFLEHMIFMGSKKYPTENEFDQYIKKCGGFDNADTDAEETSFYFEISEECLHGAFDRFTNLFIEPLMLEEAMTREREAVNSEFLSKMQGDDVRREQLMAALINEDHPSSIFAWGNLETLKDKISDEELYKKVHEFRKRHYSAHRMFACIQARYPLDTLQEFLVKYFSNIPNNKMPGLDFSNYTANWKTNTFKQIWSDKLFVVKPVANVMKIELTFILESLITKYKCKPHYFVSFLVGHEEEGSLCHYLRKKLWAVDLLAGVEETGFGFNSMYCLFTISIFLTQKGFQHIPEVVEATITYLRFLRAQGPQESIFNELQTIESNNFRFQTERNALDNVSDLVSNLKYFPPKDILSGPCLYFEYEPEEIKSILEQVNDSFMNIMITSKMPFNGHEFDLTEKWFGTKYCMIDYPKEFHDMWDNVQPFKEFTLPAPNSFVTTDFTLFYEKDTIKVPEYPEKILETDTCELWFKQDDRFLLPIAYCHFYLMSPLAKANAKNVVMMSLYNLLIKFKLVEKLYPATTAGLEYSCYTAEKGLVLKINGFNQHLHQLIDVFAKRLNDFAYEITEEEFQMFIEQQLRTYYNTIIKPKSFAKTFRLGMMDNQFCPTQEKFELLKQITLNDFQTFVQSFVKEMKIQALFQGNLNAEQSKTIMKNLLNTLKCQKIQNPSLLNLNANKLPIGDTFIRIKTMNPADVNTITVNYYQIGPISIRLNCLIDFLMIITEEPLFENLRTQEQLGYDVSCCIRDNYGALGYTIVVNSQESNHDAEYINQRIETFRKDQIEYMRHMTLKDFERFKESLIKIKSTEDNDLKDEVCRNWAEITTEEYLFDRVKREVAVLKSITHEEFMNFYLRNYNENHRKLMVQVIGNANAHNYSEDAAEDVEDNARQILASEDIFHHQFPNLEIIPMKHETCGVLVKDFKEFRKTLEQYPVLKTDLSDSPPPMPPPSLENNDEKNAIK